MKMIAERRDKNNFVSPRYVFGSNFELLIMNCFICFTFVRKMIIELAGTIKDTIRVARYSKKHEMDDGYKYIAGSQIFILT